MIRVGIIGGEFGARVHYPALRGIPGVSVVTLADRSQRTAMTCPPGLRLVSSWQDVAQADDVDAVVVAVPPGAQREIVCSALAAGKHVLCEKPFGATAADAEAMTAAPSRSGRVGAVGFQFRFEPHLAELRRQLAAGLIGKPSHIEFSWLTSGRADPSIPWSWQNDATEGGGAINAFASHAFDLVAWISGRRFLSVKQADSLIRVPSRPDRDGKPRRVTAEDEVTGEMKMDGGLSFRFSIGNCRADGEGMVFRVSGTQATLSCGQRPPFRPDDAYLVHETTSGQAEPLPFAVRRNQPGGDSRIAAVRRLAESFVTVIRGGKDTDLPLFADGLAVRRTLDALRAAAVLRPAC